MSCQGLRSKRFLACVWVLAGVASTGRWAAGAEVERAGKDGFRPPAVPLVVHDPYFSIWSASDKLAESATVHWTGSRHALYSLVRIDGKTCRVMGDAPAELPPLPQSGLEVLPTRTVYHFGDPQIAVTLTFLTPALPDDLDVLSRPVTYVQWDIRSLDGREHRVAIYFEAGGELAVNVAKQPVTGEPVAIEGLDVLRLGSRDQPVLAKKGDNLRIDWGHAYLAAPTQPGLRACIADGQAARAAFAAGKPATQQPGEAAGPPSMTMTLDLGTVGSGGASRWLMLAYDDLYSIQYFSRRLRPYWRRQGAEAADLLRAAGAELPKLQARCRAFDEELMSDLTKAGGPQYARLAALAYRQCLAGNKLAADARGMPLLFPKENFSNGCIATVDVIYPMAPQFLLFSPALSKAMLIPVLDYGKSDRWKFPFAPHDLGTYPHATGQRYGGGEKTETNQMPVEESGNMLLLLAALAEMEGNARFAASYASLLARWAEYLRQKGFDPENQLCTDDFAGHLAHNVNLSAKAILALGAYALLCRHLDQPDQATAYRRTAEEYAARWIHEADDGDHYRLAFDKPGTWSQKYNLVWDRILGLKLFPQAVFDKELAYYRKIQNRYGLPLDNRKDYTKLDWILWTATLSGSRGDFEALVGPVYDFLQQSPSRVPMTDWYWTTDGTKKGFQARPVVGGVFVKMLDEPALWKKWASRGAQAQGPWAPLPKPRKQTVLVPTAQESPVDWRYSFAQPGEGWQQPGFDDSAWKRAPAGFGTEKTPGAVVRTIWKSADIWLRREVASPASGTMSLHFLVHHDEDVGIYVNGVLAAEADGHTRDYGLIPFSPAGAAAWKPGKNLLAVHCRQTKGGQYIDLGVVGLEDENDEK